MLNDLMTKDAVVAAAKAGKEAAFNNVATIAVYALTKTTFADDGKALALPKVVMRLRGWQADGGMDYKTAARHISFALLIRKMVGTKFTEHARMKELAKAETIETAVEAMAGFLRGMGCRSAADIERWGKGDGAAIKAEDRKALLRKPVKKASEAKTGEADSDIITALEEFVAAGASLTDVEKALAWLTAKRQDLIASGAAALVHVEDDEDEADMREAA